MPLAKSSTTYIQLLDEVAFVPLDGDDSVEIAQFVGRLLLARVDYVVVVDLQSRNIGLVAHLIVDKQHDPAKGMVWSVAEHCSLQHVVLTLVQQFVDSDSTLELCVEVAQHFASEEELEVEVHLDSVPLLSRAGQQGDVACVGYVVVA